MSNKPALTVLEQIELLKTRGMCFRDENAACKILKNVSYYRLKGYWWDMQTDCVSHVFTEGSFFDDAVLRYNFDKSLRVILFEVIETIEIALRTKLIYHLSVTRGGLWYLDASIFRNQAHFERNKEELQKEFNRSRELFVIDHLARFPNVDADAWKVLEVASIGTLSKIYKNLKPQLPEKTVIAKEMGLNLAVELESWLEAIAHLRNIIAHHSRLWNRIMVKVPKQRLLNPPNLWLNLPLSIFQKERVFLVISCMYYLTQSIVPDSNFKQELKQFFEEFPSPLQIYKLGFTTGWETHPIWN